MKKHLLGNLKRLTILYGKSILSMISYLAPFAVIGGIFSLIPVKGRLQINIAVILSLLIGIFFVYLVSKNFRKESEQLRVTKRQSYLSILGITTTLGIFASTINYALVMNNAITNETVSRYLTGILFCYLFVFGVWIIGYGFYLYKFERKMSWKWVISFLPYFFLILYVKRSFNSFYSFFYSKDYDSKLVSSMLIDEKMSIEMLNNLQLILIGTQIIIFSLLIGVMISGFVWKKEKTKERKQEEREETKECKA